ncbi:MAG: hypothetical protein LHW57_01250 [Candidatus Cloacimonetes bacterium]|nr:hypothetical protein [Candidatus Cloacimonadota bacterium]
MKRTLIIIAVLLLGLALLAAEAKDEAIEALDAAKTQINKGDFAKARQEIDFALAKINEILAEDLLKFIPEGSNGFTLENKEAASLNMMGANNTAVGKYTKGDSSFDLTISVGGVLGQSGGLMGLASMFGGMAAAGKTVRVNGYTGTQEFEEDEASGTLTLKVGEQITVIVTGENIENADILQDLAELVELDKLEEAY